MHLLSLRLSLLSIVSLVACPAGPGPAPETGTASGASSSTTEDVTPTTTGPGTDTSSGTSEPGTTGTTLATTEPVDTTGGSSTSGSSTGDSSTGGSSTGTTAEPDTSSGDPDTGGEPCQFDPGMVDIPWSLEVPPELAGTDLTLTCTIVSAQEMDPKVSLTFSCNILGVPKNVVLNYTLQPFAKLLWDMGAVVELVYHTEPAPWDREWLKISGGVTNLWAVRADELAPPGVTTEQFFGRNLGLFATCQAQPDPCGSRQGLDVHFEVYVEGMPSYVPIHSGEHQVFGFPVLTLVWLAHASELLEPLGCDDVAPRRIDMVVVDDYSGF